MAVLKHDYLFKALKTSGSKTYHFMKFHHSMTNLFKAFSRHSCQTTKLGFIWAQNINKVQ